MSVDYQRDEAVAVITLNRPDRRNAVDRATASELGSAWARFDADDRALVAVFTGSGGHFSAGADLKEFDLVDDPAGYLGFTRTEVGKPTIAAVEGYCVAGGLEMALWCDLRVAGMSARFGCLERRFGVPLVDGGTQRLPLIVGRGRALDLILTGREVETSEALTMGLISRVVPDGEALAAAMTLAQEISVHPQTTLRSDRAAVLPGLSCSSRTSAGWGTRLWLPPGRSRSGSSGRVRAVTESLPSCLRSSGSEWRYRRKRRLTTSIRVRS